MEKSLNLLKNNGYFSMIIPYPFLNQNYGTMLRRYILEKHKIMSILDLSNRKVFKDAAVTNIVLNIRINDITDKIQIDKIDDIKNEIFNSYTLEKKPRYFESFL